MRLDEDGADAERVRGGCGRCIVIAIERAGAGDVRAMRGPGSVRDGGLSFDARGGARKNARVRCPAAIRVYPTAINCQQTKNG